MKRWKVTGSIHVRHGLDELRRNFGVTSPIAGAVVRVKGRKKVMGIWAPWGKFGEDVTGPDGRFSIFAARDSAKRQFKVEVKLKSTALVVYGENKNALARTLASIGPTMPIEGVLSHTGRATLRAAVHEVHRDADGTNRRSGQHNLGKLHMNSGIQQAHGDLWVLFGRLFAWFKENRIPFRGRTALKYPHNNVLVPNEAENSYCNPLNRVCYIISNPKKDQFTIDTILHELMHAWAFGNSTGAHDMAWQLKRKKEGRIKQPYVAFHEAFADWAAHWVEWGILRQGARTPSRTPLSRHGLRSEAIDRVGDVQHYHDGWLSVFRLLNCPDLGERDLNNFETAVALGPKDCNAPFIPFLWLLRTFRPHRGARLGALSTPEMRLRPFLRRVTRTGRGLQEKHVDAYLKLTDPSSTAQPWELFCD